MIQKVLLLLGGRSGEHEISLISGKHVLAAMDRTRFVPLVVVIQKSGEMHLVAESQIEALANNPKQMLSPVGTPILLRPYGTEESSVGAFSARGQLFNFDIAFPLLHGPGGEDGSIQGLFEFSGIPVVGCDVKSSAICMDKGFTKRLCEREGIPIAPFTEVYPEDLKAYLFNFSESFPLFVKPAHQGSSLGVSKVRDFEGLSRALHEVFELDSKALVETAIVGREIEVGVLGRRADLRLSPPGEIRCVKGEFYSYEAKYVDEDSAVLEIPAPMDASLVREVQRLSIQVFNTLECRGMARIDYFLTSDGRFLFNEINTIPGFTPISMYPKLMQLTGITYTDLITRLIELAL